MAEKVEIDKKTFQDRLSQFISAWKADKRSGDAFFGGVGSIVILMGKIEDPSVATFRKNNAMHVRNITQLSQPLTLTLMSLVLATWLRISCYALCLHSRNSLHRYNAKER